MKAPTWLHALVHFSANWIAMSGIALVTTAGVLWIVLFPTLLRGTSSNPYLGLLTFALLPALFFLGLALIPLGIWWQVRRDRRSGKLDNEIPPLDWHNPALQRMTMLLAGVTIANLIIGTQLSFSAVHYMESTEFCGTTCHPAMLPEHLAWQNAPHSKVKCVECHVEDGAAGFIKAKMNGTKQLWHVITGDYPRPIRAETEKLPSVDQSCEQCHSASSFNKEDLLRVNTKFGNDDANTPAYSAVVVYVRKIHAAHLGTRMKLMTKGEGHVEVPMFSAGNEIYRIAGASADPKLLRNMSCLDCHNRAAHSFESVERAVDRAMVTGDVPRTLPGIRKKSIEFLKANYASRTEALRQIPAAVRAAFLTAPGVDVDRAGRTLAALYERNVFPEMKLTWGTHPNHIGHIDSPGCFRCHDDTHKSAAGKSPTQDCATCHNMLAMDEPNPKALADLGLLPVPPASK